MGSDAVTLLACFGEVRAELKGKSLPIHVPILTGGHKVWVVTKQTRLQMQAARGKPSGRPRIRWRDHVSLSWPEKALGISQRSWSK